MMEDPYHVPQQSRRHKLRFTPQNEATTTLIPYQEMTSALNLSLSTQARSTCGGAYTPTPVGPFTGYASILARSRFLRPAQDLLDGFSAANNYGADAATTTTTTTTTSLGLNATKNVLQDSGTWFSDDDYQHISHNCSNPNLVSMLHEVYKKYKLYCQQMQSAVTSFESVAGLANAAPFVSFAVRAMFRHFHCLKNAILDQIRVTSKGFGGVDTRSERDSGSCPEDKGPFDPKQGQSQGQGSGPNFLQHPVWRSQRGFPDKAVAVLRTWLFEHFLHPYPSDSDKQMLAQKTGLSRSQVSNWFTNARVRLWKPMVEEIHTLERKAQCSKSTDTPHFNLSSDNHSSLVHPQLTEKDFEIMNRHRDHESHSKRTRIDGHSRTELSIVSKEQFGLPCSHLMPGNQMINVGGPHIGQLSHPPSRGANEQNNTGVPWSSQGQIIPFWLARQ